MALQELHFQALNSPVIDLALMSERTDSSGTRLDFNPPYQRASVWTDEQRRNLIKSLLQGLPIGAVFVNERHIMEPWVVVDGKQRLETVVQFVNDGFLVPADWFADDEVEHRDPTGLVYWSELSDRAQSRCRNHWLVAQYRTTLRTEAQERELYLRINYGGTPHEPLVAS